MGHNDVKREADERVDCAAIRVGERVWSLPRPSRHQDVQAAVFRDLRTFHLPSGAREGFTTTKGRFVDRMEAAEIAKATGEKPLRMSFGEALATNDLW